MEAESAFHSYFLYQLPSLRLWQKRKEHQIKDFVWSILESNVKE